jgi:hypothetical protein
VRNLAFEAIELGLLRGDRECEVIRSILRGIQRCH